MCKEWLERIEKGFFEQHERYLDDLQREILLRCYNSKQNFDEIATELGFARGHITGKAAELWKLLSDVFGEKVTKANLRGSVERFKNKTDSNNTKLNDTKTPKSFKIFISDRSHNPASMTEQLRIILEQAGREIILGKDWLQRSNEELNQYDCFL